MKSVSSSGSGKYRQTLNMLIKIMEIIIRDDDDAGTAKLGANCRKQERTVALRVIKLADEEIEIRVLIQDDNAFLWSLDKTHDGIRCSGHNQLSQTIRQSSIRLNDQNIRAHGKARMRENGIYANRDSSFR